MCRIISNTTVVQLAVAVLYQRGLRRRLSASVRYARNSERIADGDSATRYRSTSSRRTLERRRTISRSSAAIRSEEHTSELQSLMRISYAVFCLKKKKQQQPN